jgi:hypothetical protein
MSGAVIRYMDLGQLMTKNVVFVNALLVYKSTVIPKRISKSHLMIRKQSNCWNEIRTNRISILIHKI